MDLKTRRIVHTDITNFPTDDWTAQQVREATPWRKGPRYLIRDRKYAAHFSAMAANSGIQELKTPYRVPQANGVCERFMGSLRRESLDHMLIYDGSIYNVRFKNTRLATIKSDPIRGFVSVSRITMLCRSQSRQADGSPRRQSSAVCIIVMLVRQI